MTWNKEWNPGRARTLLIIFLTVFIAGRVGVWANRPVFPSVSVPADTIPWPPPHETRILDATGTPAGRLVFFFTGTTSRDALLLLGLEVDPLCSGFVLPRAGVVLRSSRGWRIRPMTQMERWVWRLPMELNLVDKEDLALIPGVGPKLAGKVSAFLSGNVITRTVDALDAVPGIGPKKLRLLRKYLEAD